jgi:inner membrane protein
MLVVRMEPVTHLLTGACLGRSGFNRKTAYATLAMTLAAEAPDLDMFTGLDGPVTQFCHHRGITHTLLGAPFMALGVTGVVWTVAWVLGKLGRRPAAQPVRWGWIWLLALIADLSHLLLDYTNSYGLRPLFPFNPHWYAWSIVSIFDPVMFAFLLLGLLVPALLGLVEGEMRRRDPRVLRGRGWAMAALVGVGLLYALRNAEHLHAQELARQSGSTLAQPVLRVAAEPAMADPFYWTTILETPDDYQLGTVDTLGDRVDPGAIVPKPPVTAAVRAAKATYLGRVYESWSSWPVTEDVGAVAPRGDAEPLPPGAHTVQFGDMRYARQSVESLASGGRFPMLSGWVVVGADGGIVSQWMGGRQQH